MASLTGRLGRRSFLNAITQDYSKSFFGLAFPFWEGRRSITYVSEPVPQCKYGGRYTVTLLAGDGVGPELTNYVKEVFRFIHAPVNFEEVCLNHQTSDEDYQNALLAVQRNQVALKGNVETNFDVPGFKIRNLEFRTELDLFANIVWCKNVAGVETQHKDVDLVIIRENTEGEYSQLEHEVVRGVVESLKIITEKNSMRIAKYAFDFAVRNGRKKVTAVHKANIMKMSDGLFIECCQEVANQYPDIKFETMIVDNCSMQMVSRPQQFDVVVLPNLYGNIIANIGTGLVGGAGMVSGVNISDTMAVFETGARNTGKAIKNKNVANPTAMLLASADMLAYLGLHKHADMIRDGVNDVLKKQEFHTSDLGGEATTSDVVAAILRHIRKHNKQ